MRIWHQSFTDLTVMPLYRKTIAEHAAAVMGEDAAVSVHGLRPGTYTKGCAPIDAIKYRYVATVHELQVCDAAMVAEREGFDALALGCFFDPGLRAARSLVDIPIVGLGESCALVACSLGRKFGLVTLCEDQSADYTDLMLGYGLERRFAGAVALDPPIDEFSLEADEKTARAIEERFDQACAAVVARGAEIIIPADGVLNEFLVRRHRLTARGDVPVMDSLGALFQHAAFLARLAKTTGTAVSRHQFYAKPSAAMVEHVRNFAGQRKLASDFSGDR
ncbi:MAG TPA: aspartate/glutamate racemase family protein [Burkholderiales bacterium]|nr:aspartate/glutamate racemase family protein [Burkholderiales bacterium]